MSLETPNVADFIKNNTSQLLRISAIMKHEQESKNDCTTGRLEPEACSSFLEDRVFNRWRIALCESAAKNKLHCPFKDCSALMINEGVMKEAESNSTGEDLMLINLAKKSLWKRSSINKGCSVYSDNDGRSCGSSGTTFRGTVWHYLLLRMWNGKEGE